MINIETIDSKIVNSKGELLWYVNTEIYEYNGWLITIENSSHKTKYSGHAVLTKYAHILTDGSMDGIADEILEKHGIVLDDDEYAMISFCPFMDEKDAYMHNINQESPSSVLSYFVECINDISETPPPRTVVLKQVYKKSISPKSSKTKRGFKNIAWATLVKERDGKCAECGSVYDLHAHHVKGYKRHPELRYDVNNGITLCGECHRNYHRENGK